MNQTLSPRSAKNFTFTQQTKRRYQLNLNISSSLQDLGCIKLAQSKYQIHTHKQMTSRFTREPNSIANRQRLKKFTDGPSLSYRRTYFQPNTPVTTAFSIKNQQDIFRQKALKLEKQNKNLKQELQVLRQTVFRYSTNHQTY